MLVQEVMSKHVITINMDRTLEDVRRVFQAAPFHHLVVMEDQRVVGVVSDRDLLQNLSPFLGKMAERSQDLASMKRKVHQIMTRQPRTVGPGASLAEAGGLMLRERISCLPVVDDAGGLVGIMTLRDVARATIEMFTEQEAAESRAEEDSRGEAA